MNIRKTEKLINQLLDKPTQPLDAEQKMMAFDYAVGLFVGRIGDLQVESDVTMQQLQGMHTLSQKQRFILDYFADDAGQEGAQKLGSSPEQTLLDVEAMRRLMPADQRKEMAERGSDWFQTKVVEQLAHDASEDRHYTAPARLTVNYDPDKILIKAAIIQAYRQFYRQAFEETQREPDAHLAEAKRALIHVHVGRLNTMAAVDVFPGLLSLEEQMTRSRPSPLIDRWAARLATVAPAIGRLHELEGEARVAVREVYAKHLDAIRQGAPFELDEVDETEANVFSRETIRELTASIRILAPESSHNEPTELARQLQGVTWNAHQIKACIESVLDEWGMLSRFSTSWQEVEDRDGFADDEKFQVITTPQRKNLSVDSTRRIVNIPADTVRGLIGEYPAGALPLVAHELSHVLQAFADYELGEQIPLAKIKGRRYRVLREAGGMYQERIMSRDYFGTDREATPHYLNAYLAKCEGKNRLEVARVFYESTIAGRTLSPQEDEAARFFAVNRTARLYRYGGHNSQVLDYVEQSVVCDVLMRRLQPEQVDAFLLGSASFSLEDSALLHQFGLLHLPEKAAFSPAHDVMRLFLESNSSQSE